MEKLQAALEKARKKREETGSTGPVSAGTDPAPRTRPVRGDVASRWAALPQVELSSAALAAHRVVTKEPSEASTPFDILRTKVLLQMQRNNWKRLAITSPVPQSGKTTTACNLALGLGRQNALRAMVFDFDLGSPSVASFFEFESEVRTSDVLLGKAGFAEQAVRIEENVGVLASRHVETDPTRIMLSEETGRTLDRIGEDYQPDIMIFDLPSVLVGDNARAFLKNVDCALIIARANSTRYGEFDVCERELAEHTNVLGVVLNACRKGAMSNDMD